MTSGTSGLKTYKKISVETASKEHILLMLYSAAIKNCKNAIDAIEEKNVAKKGECIGKLQDIILELDHSLDHEVGGQLAKDLSGLYEFVLHSSTQANIKIDKGPLESCLTILETLYDGWNQAVRSLSKEERAKIKG